MGGEGSAFDVPVPRDLDLGAVDVTGVSVLDALRATYGDAVRYARGCAVNDDDTSGFAEAVELAAASDVVVLVVGDKAGLTQSCTSGEGRDRSSLALPGVQEDLARAVLATGTPVVTVLVVGRPCGSEELHQRSAAVLLAWLPGQEGGAAIAEALAGTINPGGKLPISFPRSVGQLPVFYGHKVSGGRSHWHGEYVDGPTSPLYPFGHGVSYTTFELVDPVVLTPTAGPSDSITVSVSIANTGSRSGEEVVQVYVRDLHASVTRPVLELKSFAPRRRRGRSIQVGPVRHPGRAARLLRRGPDATSSRRASSRSSSGRRRWTSSLPEPSRSRVADPSRRPSTALAR